MLTLEDYRRMEEAWKYQDFITKQLLNLGLSVNAYQGVEYQMKYGESASGIEIKNDRKMSESGNVYIEFRQTTLRGSEDRESGIQQHDQSWLYVIGDYTKFYIFAKNQLKSLLEKVQANQQGWYEKYGISIRYHKNELGQITSYGMVIPVSYIEKNNLMIRKVEI